MGTLGLFLRYRLSEDSADSNLSYIEDGENRRSTIVCEIGFLAHQYAQSNMQPLIS